MNKNQKATILGTLMACFGAVSYYKYKQLFRIPLKEYTRYALSMAVLDDEICRNELEGIKLDGNPILFPPKAESLQYRYHLFLRLNQRKSRRALEAEIAALEQRLQASKHPPLL